MSKVSQSETEGLLTSLDAHPKDEETTEKTKKETLGSAVELKRGGSGVLTGPSVVQRVSTVFTMRCIDDGIGTSSQGSGSSTDFEQATDMNIGSGSKNIQLIEPQPNIHIPSNPRTTPRSHECTILRISTYNVS